MLGTVSKLGRAGLVRASGAPQDMVPSTVPVVVAVGRENRNGVTSSEHMGPITSRLRRRRASPSQSVRVHRQSK